MQYQFVVYPKHSKSNGITSIVYPTNMEYLDVVNAVQYDNLLVRFDAVGGAEIYLRSNEISYVARIKPNAAGNP